ncbi:RICH domain-containing protein, partial [Streptococcus pneumoniae]|uniref:RICH domain-containing protein n=1 Tax=Streptococcus pneumoniae TaxID=1313 RepID=UPI00067BDAFF
MFASKSERKVHYSIRKFSIGVASVVVASLFLGGVVHAEGVRSGDTPKVTSSGDEVESHLKKILSEIQTQLDRKRHAKTVALINKLQDIKRTYSYKLNVLEEKPKAELTSKTKEELTAAFEQFKKDTLPTEPGKKVAEAEKKVAEAKKKAEDQKEEDRRNYPTNTYKTLELEIAEFDVKVKEAELELLKEKAKKPLNEGTIKQAKEKVESKKAEATRLENIKTDRKKAEEEAKRKAAEEEYNRLTQQQPPKTEKPAQPSTPKTGWKQENGMWYFYNTDGSMATGWLQNNGSWYYLNANGSMATGWLQNNGSWYYLNANGAMATGWLQNNGSWYYLNSNGAMATGWLQYNSSWYYLNSNGAMVTGWLQNNGSWYYLNANGSMATDWVKDGDTWYYLEASGAMKASQWFKVSDKWYYVNGLG